MKYAKSVVEVGQGGAVPVTANFAPPSADEIYRSVPKLEERAIQEARRVGLDGLGRGERKFARGASSEARSR